MLEFRPIQAGDRPLYQKYLLAENTQNSSASFGNVYLWDLLCRRNIAVCDGRLCVEFLCRSHEPFYAFPLGEGDLAAPIEALRAHAVSCARSFTLQGVTAEERSQLEASLPGAFEFTADPDNFDYLYEAQSLATLAGKKLHGKRNHCNRFETAHRWHSEKLTPALFDDCRAVLGGWDAERSGGSRDENEAIRQAFAHWDELAMEGCVLYAEEQPVAFTIGEFIRPDTVDVHFEKATDVEGAYPMICREFIRLLLSEHPELRYVNREEDMGLPGLRKAKEDWFPIAQVEKYTAVWKAQP